LRISCGDTEGQKNECCHSRGGGHGMSSLFVVAKVTVLETINKALWQHGLSSYLAGAGIVVHPKAENSLLFSSTVSKALSHQAVASLV